MLLVCRFFSCSAVGSELNGSKYRFIVCNIEIRNNLFFANSKKITNLPTHSAHYCTLFFSRKFFRLTSHFMFRFFFFRLFCFIFIANFVDKFTFSLNNIDHWPKSARNSVYQLFAKLFFFLKKKVRHLSFIHVNMPILWNQMSDTLNHSLFVCQHVFLFVSPDAAKFENNVYNTKINERQFRLEYHPIRSNIKKHNCAVNDSISYNYFYTMNSIRWTIKRNIWSTGNRM